MKRAPFWPRMIWQCLGIIALLGTAAWGTVGFGIPAITSMHGYDLFVILIYLAIGPLALYPLALLAARNPRRYGALTIMAGLTTAFMALYVIPHENMRGKLFFESTAMLLSVSLPMLIVGIWECFTGAVEDSNGRTGI